MLKVKLKQAAHLSGRDYPLGDHDMDEAVACDEYFKVLQECGLLIVLEAPLEVEPPSVEAPKSEDLVGKKKRKKR